MWYLCDPTLPTFKSSFDNQYFKHFFSSTKTAPLFVFQWLFDEAQMSADSVGAPVTPQQWDYIHEMGKALRSSLDNVTAVFAPSCIGHSVLTKRDWLDIKIDDISLADALRCWENSGTKRRGSQKLTKEQRMERKRLRLEAQKQFGKRRKLSKEERELRRLKRQERRERRRKLREERRGATIVDADTNVLNAVPAVNKKRLMNKNMPKLIENENLNRRRHKNSTNHHRHEKNNQRKRLHLQQNSNNINVNQRHPQISASSSSNANFNHNHNNKNKKVNGNYNRNSNNNNNDNNRNRNNNNKNRIEIPEPKKCTLRLLEQCSWPQCNQSCPILRNPLTGEEMKFLELLASFGLDMDGVAGALGVDMQTLNNMEHTELVRLLTQHP